VTAATRTCDDDSMPNSQSAPHALLTLGTKSQSAAQSLPNLETKHPKANGAKATHQAPPRAAGALRTPHPPTRWQAAAATRARRASAVAARAAIGQAARPRLEGFARALQRVRTARLRPGSAGSAPPTYRWPCATRCRSRRSRPRGLFSAWRCTARSGIPLTIRCGGVAVRRGTVVDRPLPPHPPSLVAASPLPPTPRPNVLAARTCTLFFFVAPPGPGSPFRHRPAPARPLIHW